jgi:hypothetical protein
MPLPSRFFRFRVLTVFFIKEIYILCNFPVKNRKLKNGADAATFSFESFMLTLNFQKTYVPVPSYITEIKYSS